MADDRGLHTLNLTLDDILAGITIGGIDEVTYLTTKDNRSCRNALRKVARDRCLGVSCLHCMFSFENSDARREWLKDLLKESEHE